MNPDPLHRLVADAESLMLVDEGEAPVLVDMTAAAPRSARDRRLASLAPARRGISLNELKTRVRELIAELARRVDGALPETLAQAHRAWDQVDALRLIDKAVDDEVRALVRQAALLESDTDSAERRALGLEGRLTLEAAVGLVALVEQRLATLVRVRLRGVHLDGDHHEDDAEPDVERLTERLLPGGRPFLDLGAALHETARRWT
ncbi:MAG: hypothetical protein ABI321_21965 [Polyangia bacterium]